MPEEIKIIAEPKDTETCSFVVDQPVYEGGSAFFNSPERAKGSPLAERLLALDGVESVLVQDNRVTISAKGTGGEWLPLAKQVGTTIRAVLQSGEQAVSSSLLDSMPPADQIRKTIEELFAREINPAIAAHGGFVELLDVKGNEVYLRLGGGCQGCGMADVTLKQGIEGSIRKVVPEIGAIMDTTDHGAGRNPYYAPSK
jgi:Fe-S cluster biogenesis protein NfuA